MFRKGENFILVQYDLDNGIKCPLPEGAECEDYLRCPEGVGEECIINLEEEASSLFDSFDIAITGNVKVTITNEPGSHKYEAKVGGLESIETMMGGAEIKKIDLKNRTVTIGYCRFGAPRGEISYSSRHH